MSSVKFLTLMVTTAKREALVLDAIFRATIQAVFQQAQDDWRSWEWIKTLPTKWVRPLRYDKSWLKSNG